MEQESAPKAGLGACSHLRFGLVPGMDLQCQLETVPVRFVSKATMVRFSSWWFQPALTLHNLLHVTDVVGNRLGSNGGKFGPT